MAYTSKSIKPKIFLHYLTDIRSAKMTKMDTLRKFHELYEDSDPLIGLIYQAIEKRTIEYGKYFERISFAEFMEITKLSKRKIQYMITSLLSKGLIVRASSKIDGYRYHHAYSFNWLVLSDDPVVKAEFLKEYNRLRETQNMSLNDEVIGARGAHSSENGRTKCDLNNNSHNSLRNKKEPHCCVQQAERSISKKENKMNIEELMRIADEKNEKASIRKAEKFALKARARKTITGTEIKNLWKTAMMQSWPNARILPFSSNTENKLAAKLRRDFSAPSGEINVAAALEFVGWTITNWNLVMDEVRTWWNKATLDQLPDVPDPQFVLAIYSTALRMKEVDGAEAAREHVLKLNDPDPMVRERAKLEAKGHSEEYIQAALSRRKKHITREDKYEQVRKKVKAMRDAMDFAQRGMYSTYAKAAKNAQRIARETGTLVPVEDVKKPLMGQTVDGPDGKQYPIEVMLFFKPAPWNDDPDVMQRDMDQAFMDAVVEFEAKKDTFEAE